MSIQDTNSVLENIGYMLHRIMGPLYNLYITRGLGARLHEHDVFTLRAKDLTAVPSSHIPRKSGIECELGNCPLGL